MAKRRKRYTQEFKAEALRLVVRRGTRTMMAEQELLRLRREIADRRRDREALVKSSAFFVKDRK